MIGKSEVSLKFFYLTVIFSFILVIAAFPVHSDTENIQKDVDNPTPSVGDFITYTVTLVQTNPTTGNVVQVTDYLPAEVAYVSAVADPDTDITVTGQEVLWWSDNYPQYPGYIPMPIGKTRTLEITVEVIDCGMGIENLAEVTASQGAGDISVGEQATAIIDVECLPTQNIFKEVNNPTPSIGDNITYTVTLTQTSIVEGNMVQVTDWLPDEVSYVSHSAPAGTTVEVSGQTILWKGTNPAGLIPVPVGATVALDITVEVVDCGDGIENLAEVTASQGAGDIAVGEQATAIIDVECLPTQNIFKEVDNPTPSIGDNITYTVTLTQTSAVEGNMVQVTDWLPDEVSYVSHSAPAGTTVEVSGQTILWKGTNPAGLIPVPVGATVALDITVEVVDCGDGIENLAEVTASQGAGDIEVGEQATATIDVECPPTQNIFKEVDNPTPFIGENITYTITLVQTNPTTGNVVQVTDWLPDEVSYVSSVADPDTTVEVDGQEVFWYGNYPEYEYHIPMPIGKTRQLQLTVKVVGYGEDIENLAEVTSSRGDGDIAEGEQATATIDAKFNIFKEVDNPTPYKGNNITYTIILRQTSAVEGNMVQVTDTLPAEVAYVSHSAPAGTTVEVSGQTILWKGTNPAGLIPVPVGATVALEITVETIVEYGKDIENTAEVTASQGGGDIKLGDQATVSIDILYAPEGTWNLTHDWSVTSADSAGNEGVNPLGSTLLTIDMYTDRFGLFETGDGNDGILLYNSEKNTVWLIFRTGCEPIYYSRDFDGVGYMSGRMRCRTGPGSGTWEATRQ